MNILLTFLTCLMVALGSADAATYYVSPTGNDSNPGTEERPFLKRSKACSLVQPGDTVVLRAGFYGSTGAWGCGTGASWDLPITIRPYPGETIIFGRADPTKGTYYNPGNLSGKRYVKFVGEFMPDPDPTQPGIRTFIWDNIGVAGDGQYVWLENTEHKNCKCTSAIEGGNYWVLINIDVHHNGWGGLSHGMYTHMSYSTMINSRFHHNSGWGVHMYNNKANTGQCTDGQPESAATPTGCGLIGNVIDGLYAYENGEGGLILSPGMDNVVINSVLNTNGDLGIKANSLNAILLHNTLYRNSLWIAERCDGCIAENNLVWTPGGGTAIRLDSGAGGVIMRHNYTSNEAVPPVPIMVDAENGNFHLVADSPAVDAGIVIAEVGFDRLGTPRPQGAASDIGAYELVVDLPEAPQGVMATLLCEKRMQVDWLPVQGAVRYQLYVRQKRFPDWRIPVDVGDGQRSVYSTNLASGAQYYFALSAVDQWGQEGEPSVPVLKSVHYFACP
jgi:hypothetical protein